MRLAERLLQASGVIFDFDGTLVDSEDDWQKMYRDTVDRIPPEGMTRLLTPPCPRELFPGDEDFEPSRSPSGVPHITMGQMAVFAAPYLNQEPEAILGWWSDMICQIYDTCPVVPGASDLLCLLAASHKPSAVATMSLEHPCCRWLTQKGVSIPVITGECERVLRAKPDPRVFSVAAEAIDADPRKCIVFEDTVHGATGARRAGCYVVGIKHCISEEDAERLQQVADEVIDDYEGLVGDIRDLLGSA